MVERKVSRAASKAIAIPTVEILESMDVGLQNMKELARPCNHSNIKRSAPKTASDSYDDNPVHDDFDDGKWMNIG